MSPDLLNIYGYGIAATEKGPIRTPSQTPKVGKKKGGERTSRTSSTVLARGRGGPGGKIGDWEKNCCLNNLEKKIGRTTQRGGKGGHTRQIKSGK